MRQFSSSDTSTWQEQYGIGKNGNLTITSPLAYGSSFAGSTNSPGYASVNASGGTSGATTLTVTDVSGASNIVPYDLILIHQTQFGTQGQWELNVSLSTFPNATSGTVNLKYPLQNNYTTGAQVIKLSQWLQVDISSQLTPITPWNGSYGGVVPIFASYSITLEVAGSISSTGFGFRGGLFGASQQTGYIGESYDHSWNTNQSTGQQAGGGGAGKANAGSDAGAGGGGGGYASGGGNGGTHNSSSAGQGGSTFGQSNLQIIFLGPGGGGNGMDTGLVPQNGQIGGGIIMLFAPSIIINGTIFSNGNDAQATSYACGGAGAGGSLLIKGNTVNIASLDAHGGAQSANTGWNAWGGAGGVGRAHVEYGTSATVTTWNSASHDAPLQDNILNVPPKTPGIPFSILF